MGLVRKRDEEEREYIEGIEIIERSDVPGDLEASPVAIVNGPDDEVAVDEDDLRGAEQAAEDAGDADSVPTTDDDGESVGSSAAEDPDARNNSDAKGSSTSKMASEGGNLIDHEDGQSASAADDSDAQELDATDAVSDITEPGTLDRFLSNRKLVVAGVAVALIIAALLGYAVGSGVFSPHGLGAATVSEDQLDTPVASYTYGGATHQVTAREALESAYVLSQIEDDGSYPAPSAEVVVACVRRSILLSEARSRGIEATDDELAAYASDVMGTDDFDTIAGNYDTTADEVRRIAEESLLIQKLYEQIAPETVDLTVPTMPTAPAEGSEDTPTAEYGAYLVGLLGDEWDADAGTWARTDGPFYQALSGETFSADSATYNQALTAYYIAYQNYSDTATKAQTAWTDYANGLYEGTEVTLYGIFQ